MGLNRRWGNWNFTIGKEEIANVVNVLVNNEVSSVKGNAVSQFEHIVAHYCNQRHGIAVSNGTAALHLALLSIGIKKGDE